MTDQEKWLSELEAWVKRGYKSDRGPRPSSPRAKKVEKARHLPGQMIFGSNKEALPNELWIQQQAQNLGMLGGMGMGLQSQRGGPLSDLFGGRGLV